MFYVFIGDCRIVSLAMLQSLCLKYRATPQGQATSLIKYDLGETSSMLTDASLRFKLQHLSQIGTVGHITGS